MNNPSSIYIHIPFCKTKCPYCDFASWANKEHLIKQYFNSLINEIKIKGEAYSLWNKKLFDIKTIFIGGGTPSLINPTFYHALFSELKKFFSILNTAEITLELNPGTANLDYLKEYKTLGINRLSIGAQSFNDTILNTLGRGHSCSDTYDAIEKAYDAGFSNISLDLIFSVPGMDYKIWEDTIYKALSFSPKHISAYSLIIEPNTPFDAIYKNAINSLITDDTAYNFYSSLCNILKENNFIHYEVSNFAKENFESLHNLTYWHCHEYFAFGNSAHRYLNGLRSFNSRDLHTYIENPFFEHITDFSNNYFFEKAMLNSRLKSGISLSEIKELSKKNSVELNSLLKDLSDCDYLKLVGDNIHLSEKGLFVNNEIFLKLIG